MTKDYRLAGLAGFLTGICLIPTAINSGYNQTAILVALPVVGAIGIVFGVWLGKFLSNFLTVMFQMSRFAAVGVLNTAINFAVINIISLITGVTSGLSVGGYNLPATIVAATNSYFWNKYWVFAGSNQGAFRDVPKFIVVTTLGYLSRSAILVIFTSYVEHNNYTGGAWLNIANVIATFAGIVVDYLGYKFLVFRKAEK